MAIRKQVRTKHAVLGSARGLYYKTSVFFTWGGTQENLCFGPFSCVLNLPHVAPIPPPGSNMLWSIAGVYLDAAGTAREGEAA